MVTIVHSRDGGHPRADGESSGIIRGHSHPLKCVRDVRRIDDRSIDVIVNLVLHVIILAGWMDHAIMITIRAVCNS